MNKQDNKIIEEVLKEVTQKAILIALEDGMQISKEDINEKNFVELQTFTIQLTLKLQRKAIINLIEDEFTDERLENYSDSDLKALRNELIKTLKEIEK